MAWTAVLLIVVAFGGMAVACVRSERAEERRILARAEAILARTSIVLDAPAPADAAVPAERDPGERGPVAAPPERREPVARRGRVRSAV